MEDYLGVVGKKAARGDRITLVLDKGQGLSAVRDMLQAGADYITMVKLGWGTSYVTKNLEKKIALYKEYSINVYLGGTLFELAYLKGKLEEYIGFLKKAGITTIEISNGTLEITPKEKTALIEKLSRDFTVLSEIGSKDAETIMPPYKWIELARAELAAGAKKIICESRESGTVGIYRASGEVRFGLIDELITQVEPNNLIFEAPLKSQQVWFVRKFGADVNLGNIAFDDVIALETLRMGLRGDTLEMFHCGK